MTPQQLRKIRRSLDLTQQQAADKIGVSLRYWSYRENGHREIPKWMIAAVKSLKQKG